MDGIEYEASSHPSLVVSQTHPPVMNLKKSSEQIEFLLKHDRKEEACYLISATVRGVESAAAAAAHLPRVQTPGYVDGNLEYQQMKATERLLGQTLRAGQYEDAKALISALEEDPANMSFFSRCRNHFLMGLVSENQANGEADQSCEHWLDALRIYNEACHEIEVSHVALEQPDSKVWFHDHLDCAVLFFAAARVCITLGECLKHGSSIPSSPCSIVSLNPSLTQATWNQQALHFLERGRARALQETRLRNVPELVEEAIRNQDDLAIVDDTDSSESRARITPDPSPEPTTTTEAVNHGQPPRIRKRTASDSFWWMIKEQRFKKRALSASSQNSAPPETSTSLSPRERQEKARSRWKRAGSVAVEAGRIVAMRPKLDLEKIYASIPEDAAAIEYALVSVPFKPGLITIIATSRGIEHAVWVPLNARHVDTRVKSLLKSLERQIPDQRRQGPENAEKIDYGARAKSLKEALQADLVHPIEEIISSKKRLIVVPSGNLANAPWSMMFDKPVSVVPSLSLWLDLNTEAIAQKMKPVPSTAFISNRPLEKSGFEKTIQYSRLEALYLSRLHDDWPMLGDDSTSPPLEELLQRDIVHLCGHSDYNNDRPLETGFYVFEHPLTIADWTKLKVHASLVIFSSCLSAFMKTSESGSGFGFSNTLLSTGTRAFVGSLWPVNDRATLLFMKLFYDELRQGIAPADAIHTAQKHLRELTEDELLGIVSELEDEVSKVGWSTVKSYVSRAKFYLKDLRYFDIGCLQNPAYWAAFTLVGHGFQPLYQEGTDMDTSLGEA